MNPVSRLIRHQKKKPFSVAAFFSVVAFVGLSRAALELSLCATTTSTGLLFALNCVSFYLAIGLLFALVSHALIGGDWRHCLNVVTVGVFIGIFPPLIDSFLGNVLSCQYAYSTTFFEGFSWWLYDPSNGVPAGESFAAWFAISMLPVYIFHERRSLLRALLGLIAAYGVFLVLAVLSPSLAVWLRKYGPASGVHLDNRALIECLTVTLEISLASVSYLILNRPLAARLFKRLLHALPFLSLVLLGAVVTRWFQTDNQNPGYSWMVVIAPMTWMLLIMLSTIAQNDYFDRAHDPKNQRDTVTTFDDVLFLTITGWLLAAAVTMTVARLGLMLGLFALSSMVYNWPYYRAKRYFPANGKIEAVWGWTSYMSGALVVSGATLPVPVASLVASGLVFGGWSVFSSFRDFKDIPADRREGVQTIYVLGHKRGWSLRRIHVVLRSGLGIGMLIPPLLALVVGLKPWTLLLPLGPALVVWYALGLGPRLETVRAGLLWISIYVASLALAILLSGGGNLT